MTTQLPLMEFRPFEDKFKDTRVLFAINPLHKENIACPSKKEYLKSKWTIFFEACLNIFSRFSIAV